MLADAGKLLVPTAKELRWDCGDDAVRGGTGHDDKGGAEGNPKEPEPRTFDKRFNPGDVTPNLHPVAIRAWALFDGPPVLYPGSMLASGLYLPGLTPADKANSAGVIHPSEV